MSSGIDHLHATLADLMRWITTERLAATVIGGVAAGLLGQPRLTEDVDAIFAGVDAETLLTSGGRYGFTPRVADVLDFSHRNGVLLMRHTSGIDVDISLAGLPFEREVIDRAQTITIAGGLRMTIASPEDLIIMKALARRPQDIADIAGIIDVQTDLDMDRIRRWVREFSAILDMPEIHDDLELLLRRRKR